MKKIQNWGMFALLAFFCSPFFTSCDRKSDFYGIEGDRNLEITSGDVTNTIITNYGDTIVTVNSGGNTTITYNGDVITVGAGGIFHVGDNTYMWNSNNHTVTTVNTITQYWGDIITVGPGGIYNTGSLVNGNVFYNTVTNEITTITNVGGDYWVASTQNTTNNTTNVQIWNTTCNCWQETTSITQNFGAVITIGAGGIYNSGSLVNGNVFYDQSTNNITTVTNVTNVEGDFWQASTQNVTTNTNTIQTWNITNNSWEISVVNNCCIPCGTATDTFIKYVVVFDTLTHVVHDTVPHIVIVENDCKPGGVVRPEKSWFAMHTPDDMKGLKFFSGGTDTVHGLRPWGNGVYGTSQITGGPANGWYQGTSTAMGQTLNFEVKAQTSAGNWMTDQLAINMMAGPLLAGSQFVELRTVGTVPSGYLKGNHVEWFDDGVSNGHTSALNVLLTQSLKDWLAAPNGPGYTVVGWTSIKPNQTLWDLGKSPMTNQYMLGINYHFPNY